MNDSPPSGLAKCGVGANILDGGVIIHEWNLPPICHVRDRRRAVIGKDYCHLLVFGESIREILGGISCQGLLFAL